MAKPSWKRSVHSTASWLSAPRGIYSFSHLTFQEYYTAQVAENAKLSKLERLTTHLSDRRWREVFLMTASLLHEASPLFTGLQKAAQHLMENRPHILATQTWSSQCHSYQCS